MKHAYHSALTEPEDSRPLDHCWIRDSVAMVHDVWKELPPEFSWCDVFYGEPPWPAGYDKFNARAGLERRASYPEFAGRLDALALTLKKPLVYIIGRGSRRYFHPDSERVVMQHDHSREPSIAIAYRLSLPECTNSEALLHWLAESYERVGDFMAGYGRSGRIFLGHGKKFVMSDCNPLCIGVIADRAAGWLNGDR